MNRRVHVLIVLMLLASAFNLFDVLTTSMLLSVSGIHIPTGDGVLWFTFYEANPYARGLFDALGVPLTMFLKVISMPLLELLLLQYVLSRNRVFQCVGLGVAAAMALGYGLVVANNVHLIGQADAVLTRLQQSYNL